MSVILGLAFGGEHLYAALVRTDGDTITIDAARAVAPAAGSAGTRVARLADALLDATAEMPIPVDRCALALPPSWAPVMSMPVEQGITEAQLRSRAVWEAASLFPTDAPDAIAVSVHQTGDPLSRIATFFDKRMLTRIHELLDAMGRAPALVAAEHVAANAALSAAYPDFPESITIRCDGNETIAVPHREGRSAGIVIRAAAADQSLIADLSGHRILYGIRGPMLFYGEALTHALVSDTALSPDARAVRRFNPFRNTLPGNLSEREITYCRRTAHLFPAAVGAAILARDARF
jgi:hypothetical protein